jgi:hypothetical protein
MHPTKEPLIGLIHDARQEQVVLPEFQRSFIWDRQSIEELLVSTLNNYFIGSLLFLSVLPDDHPFKARKMEARHSVGGTRQILQTHFIDEDAYQAMKDDNYPAFLDAREAASTKEIINRCVYPLPS